MNPYRSQPRRAFWPTTFGRKDPLAVDTWHKPKFSIDGRKVATAGSCFAQHIGRSLRANGLPYMDLEPAPVAFPQDKLEDFGYGLYSARYGNVYTTRQLLQLAQRAFGEFTPTDGIWDYKGGVVDAFRPTIEPEPFGSVRELETCRAWHLEAVAELFCKADLIIFTLGLTETFQSRADGAVYPICPGVSGGSYSDELYEFINLDYNEVVQDFVDFMKLIGKHNPAAHYLLTVSPVPLMATATRHNVGVATTYSKSVLRAATGALSENFDIVDYFPSYEIITMPAMEGRFFADDRRSVLAEGVAHVMKNFLASYGFANSAPAELSSVLAEKTLEDHSQSDADLVCDEELLASFAHKQGESVS